MLSSSFVVNEFTHSITGGVRVFDNLTMSEDRRMAKTLRSIVGMISVLCLGVVPVHAQSSYDDYSAYGSNNQAYEYQTSSYGGLSGGDTYQQPASHDYTYQYDAPSHATQEPALATNASTTPVATQSAMPKFVQRLLGVKPWGVVLISIISHAGGGLAPDSAPTLWSGPPFDQCLVALDNIGIDSLYDSISIYNTISYDFSRQD